MKILITGAVKAGKTRMAKEMVTNELPLKQTDELIGKMDWSAESAEVASWFDSPDSFICEGATVVRAIRKWLASHPTGKPADKVIYLLTPHEELTTAQRASCKAQMTIWKQVEAELGARGVEVEILGTPEGTANLKA